MQPDDAPPAASLAQGRASDDAEMFELAPVALWLEDFSEVKVLFDRWRAEGVTNLRAFLSEDPLRVQACSQSIRLVKVNRRALSLFGADDFNHLVDNLQSIFRKDMFRTHIEELTQLWEGKTSFHSNAVNYTIGGRRLDIQLTGTVLPGHEDTLARVLVCTEDVTARELARQQLAMSESYARGLFEHSPVSLWVEDFSAIKELLDEVRRQGITDFRVFTDVHPEFVTRCMSEIRVLDVNQHTLELFHAPDKDAFLRRLGDVFRDKMRQPFREQLIDLWNGQTFQQREVVNYSLTGEELHLHLQFSVLPGYEHDWSLVQVALTDITARKKAESYLEFLGKHDVLTKLYNRSFYVDELNRLQRRKASFPVSVIIADLNGLKRTNDQFGHTVGDELLRRIGEVMNELVERPCHACRIGGDEFAVLMPGTDERAAAATVDNLRKLIELNNQFYAGHKLSMSIGVATGQAGEALEDVIRQADITMYEAKRAYYANPAHDQRRRIGS